MTFRIGGSEAAAACGINPYTSRIALWLDKTGKQPLPQAGEAAKWGQVLEPVLRDELRQTLGIIEEWTPATLAEVRPADLPEWVQGTPDGFLFQDGDLCLVELKTVGLNGASAWDDDSVPITYQVQAQVYMAITAAKRMHFGCLVGGQRFITRTLDFDLKVWGTILSLLVEFKDLVDRDEAPAPDGTDGTTNALKLLYPAAHAETVELPEHKWPLLEQARKARDARKASEVEEDRIIQEIKMLMGDASNATVRGVTVATWRNTSRTGTDTDKLKSEHPEAFEACLTTTTFRRFALK